MQGILLSSSASSESSKPEGRYPRSSHVDEWKENSIRNDLTAIHREETIERKRSLHGDLQRLKIRIQSSFLLGARPQPILEHLPRQSKSIFNSTVKDARIVMAEGIGDGDTTAAVQAKVAHLVR